jgi:hypothetical protein
MLPPSKSPSSRARILVHLPCRAAWVLEDAGQIAVLFRRRTA